MKGIACICCNTKDVHWMSVVGDFPGKYHKRRKVSDVFAQQSFVSQREQVTHTGQGSFVLY